ncbi:hypothetical protein [Parasitella parasitica]|uniref:Uncharacterized protein n=1 Tax=Parasitella parasitica TaxID=35722 RepID=A0A0B7N5J5_9FUNG|nr:hypothetical protein [Parasitella parasitica]
MAYNVDILANRLTQAIHQSLDGSVGRKSRLVLLGTLDFGLIHSKIWLNCVKTAEGLGNELLTVLAKLYFGESTILLLKNFPVQLEAAEMLHEKSIAIDLLCQAM